MRGPRAASGRRNEATAAIERVTSRQASSVPSGCCLARRSQRRGPDLRARALSVNPCNPWTTLPPHERTSLWTRHVASRSWSGAQQWPHYAGDQAASHYSPLDQITAGNVGKLAIAWEWKPNEKVLPQFGTRPGAFQNTPLVIDNVLYLSTPYNQVAALDADHAARNCGDTIRRPTKTASRPTARASRIAASWRGATLDFARAGRSCASSSTRATS